MFVPAAKPLNLEESLLWCEMKSPRLGGEEQALGGFLPPLLPQALPGWRTGMLPGRGGMHVGWWAGGSDLLAGANKMNVPFLDACDEKTDARGQLRRKDITFLLGCR